MATVSTGWACTHSASVISQTDTTATIRVICYWQNQGWTYNINYVSAWVYCNGAAYQVMSSGSVNSTSSNTAAVSLGYHDFVINKGTAAQSISCYATITSNSSYVSGTKSSSATSVGVSAKTSYTVSYNANGGSGAPASQTKWYGDTLTLSSTKPTRTGHTFSKWNTNTSGTGTSYSPGGTYTGNAALTLYAIWTANTYTVSYNANGGSGAPASQTKTYGVDLTLSSTIPTRTNYNFLGWSTSASGSVVYSASGKYTSNAAVTLYAVWELAYVKPRLSSFSAQRCTSDGTASEDGTYLKVTFNWGTDKTVSAIKIQYKLQTATTWTDVTVTASGTSGSVSQVIGSGGISIESSYHVRAYVSDSGGTTYSIQVLIGTVKFPIDVKSGGTGVAIGKVSEKDAFEVNMDIYDKFGELINNGLAEYRNGAIDANETLSELCLSHTNTPGNGYYFVMTLFYSTKSTNARRTQIGIPYIYAAGQSRKHLCIRQYVDGAWNDWYFPASGTILFDDSSGTTGTVTLSESAANFIYLEIYCQRASYGYYGATKIHSPNGKQVNLTTSYYTNSNFYHYTKNITISGTSITVNHSYLQSGSSGNAMAIGTDDANRIIRVVGYR